MYRTVRYSESALRGLTPIEAIETLPVARRTPWVFRRLPVLPTTALQIIEVLDDEESSLDDFVAIFNRSPEITAAILRLANSPQFGLSRTVDALQSAISIVGADRARHLALEHSMNGLLSGISHYPALAAIWSECIATAVIAKALAPFFDVSPPRAYTEGLLHDIGRLALCNRHPQCYVDVLETVHAYNLDLLDAERSLFDIDHCEAGAWLVRRWGLPEGLEEVSRFHHGDDLRDRDHLTLIKASWQLAAIIFATSQDSQEQRRQVAALEYRLPLPDATAGVEAVLGASSLIAGWSQ